MKPIRYQGEGLRIALEIHRALSPVGAQFSNRWARGYGTHLGRHSYYEVTEVLADSLGHILVRGRHIGTGRMATFKVERIEKVLGKRGQGEISTL